MTSGSWVYHFSIMESKYCLTPNPCSLPWSFKQMNSIRNRCFYNHSLGQENWTVFRGMGRGTPSQQPNCFEIHCKDLTFEQRQRHLCMPRSRVYNMLNLKKEILQNSRKKMPLVLGWGILIAIGRTE